MTASPQPGGSFNFRVTIVPESGSEVVGGFSEVTGLTAAIVSSDAPFLQDSQNRPRRAKGTYKIEDVTLKRGVVAGHGLMEWLDRVAKGDPSARATVRIDLHDEGGSTVVATWTLVGARPMKWTGPTLAAQGGDEVALEELTLVHEGVTFQ